MAMSAVVSKLIQIAKNEIGYLEKKSNSQLNSKTANAGSGNYTKYGAWYEGGWANGLAWCAIFVCWCANQAGVLDNKIICRKCSCDDFVSFYKKQSRWHPRGTYTPKPGDLILFATSPPDASHIGIVVSVSGGRVYTIEGNTSGGSTLVANGGGVASKSYPLTYNRIYGYCNPAYPTSSTTASDEDEVVYVPKNVNMKVNGKITQMSSIEHKGENYVRLRDLSKAGLAIDYDASANLPSIQMPVKNLKMNIDGKSMTVPNFQLNGTNYGAVRALMEGMGYKVDWDEVTCTVICKK